MICWITSTREAGGSQGLGDTSGREVAQAGSKPLEVRGVPPQKELEGPQTTPSEAIVERRELTRLPWIPEPMKSLDGAAQTGGGRCRRRDGPTADEEHPTSMLEDLELGTCRAAASCWP